MLDVCAVLEGTAVCVLHTAANKRIEEREKTESEDEVVSFTSNLRRLLPHARLEKAYIIRLGLPHVWVGKRE